MRFAAFDLGSITDATTRVHWTSARLEEEVGRRVSALRRAGIARQSRVVLAHGGSPEFFADLLAVWEAGGAACCLNPALTDPELETICTFVRPGLVLLGGSRERLPGGCGVRAVTLASSIEAAATDDQPDTASELDDPALVLFTSGTTGSPKGVVHTFRSLLARLALNQAHVATDDRNVTLCPLPTHFGHGLIGNSLTSLLDKGHLVLASGGAIAVEGTLGALIDEYGVGFMSSVPAMWKRAVHTRPPAGGTLKRVHVGSAPLSADLWRRIIEWSGTRQVVNMYGITETANWLAGASAVDFDPEDGVIGRMWGGAAAVQQPDGRLRSSGTGELVVQSPALMAGYLDRPDLTAAVLKAGWFHTGDVGAIDESGVIRLTGRQKYEINRAGLKVHPEDIDLLLERHESVREACAFGFPDDLAGELVGVAVCPASGEFNLDAVRRWCQDRLSSEKVPDRWFVVDEIPKSDRGKVNRDAVARYCLAHAPAGAGRANGGSPNARRVLAALLGLEPAGVPDSAAMGTFAKWDSLMTVQVILAAEDILQRRLSEREVLAAQSCQGLQAVLDSAPLAPLVRGSEGDVHDQLLHRLRMAGAGRSPVTHLLLSYGYCRSVGIAQPEAFIQRLMDEFPESCLVMGAFTWAFARGTPFHFSRSATELGVMNELFRRQPGVVRSRHPVYSYAAHGPGAAELLRQDGPDGWGAGSVARRLLESDGARVISVGLEPARGHGLALCTGLHVLEQEFGVPYRFFKAFDGTADFGEGPHPYRAVLFVRKLDQCAANSWTAAERVLQERGQIYVSDDRSVLAYDNRDLRTAGRELLTADRAIFRAPVEA